MTNSIEIFITTIFLSAVSLTFASNRVALVIGNQDYHNDELETPINDATSVAEKLKKLGFTVIPVGKNLDRHAMLQKVREFRKQINRNTEIALLYYAGHGAQYNNESYLIPLRANLEYANDLPIEAVKAKDILNQIEEQNAKVNVMILDACRNLPLKRANRSNVRGLAPMESHSSTLIAYSTKAGDVAKDKGKNGGNSPYTEVLLDYLDKPNIPLTQLFNDISYDVYQTYQQEPWMSSSRIPRVFLKVSTEQSANSPQNNNQTVDITTTQPISTTQPIKPVSRGQKIDHYIVYDDGTAKDTKTGLTWQRCTYGQTWNGSGCSGTPKRMTWFDAMKLNKNGWRLPTIDELGTIVYCSSGKPSGYYPNRLEEAARCKGDYRQPTLNTAVFPMEKEHYYFDTDKEKVWAWADSYYWSSSQYRSNVKGKWAISFVSGDDFGDFTDVDYYVRLVRGGQ